MANPSPAITPPAHVPRGTGQQPLAYRQQWGAEKLSIHFKHWNDQNIAALQTLANNLTPKTQEILGLFAADGGQALLPRLTRSGIKRPSLPSNVALFIAAIFGKI